MNAVGLDLVRAYAPLAIVALPLAGAAIAFVLGGGRLAWGAALAGSVGGGVLAVDLALRILLFSGAAPAEGMGAALRADGVGIFAAAIVAGAGLLTVIAAGHLCRDFETRAAPLAMTLLACVGAGWCAALFARDLLGVVIASELAWLAATGLTAFAGVRERGAINGALRMLSVGGAGAALSLFGLALIYRAFGTLDLDAMALAQLTTPSIAAAGIGLLLTSLLLKAGVAPLHHWAPAAYGRGGGLAALCLGAVSAVGAMAVIVRVTAYAIRAPEIGAGLSWALGGLGALSVLIGSVQAIGARDLGRLAAYVCAAQGGCILLSIALGSPAGFAAALVQVLALAAAALGLLAGAAAGRVSGLEMLDGLGKRAPLASAALTASALSLMGAPLTLGFLGRWRLVEAGVGAGWWWAAGAVIIASLAGVFYGGRVIERLYFRRAAEAYTGARGGWATAPALAVGIVLIALGVAPGALLYAASAATAMMAGG